MRWLNPFQDAFDMLDAWARLKREIEDMPLGRPQYDMRGWTLYRTHCGGSDQGYVGGGTWAEGYCPAPNTQYVPGPPYPAIPAGATRAAFVRVTSGPFAFNTWYGQPTHTYDRAPAPAPVPKVVPYPALVPEEVPAPWKYPDVAPEQLPINRPTPRPEPSPYPDIPDLDDEGRGGPLTDRGNNPRRAPVTVPGPNSLPGWSNEPWPGAPPLPGGNPIPYPGVTTWPDVGPGRGVQTEVRPGQVPSPVTPTPAKGRSPARSREKERKFFVHGRGGPIEWIISGLTESLDLLDAAYYSLPCDKQIRGKASPMRKAQQLYKNINYMRPDKFADNLIQNELTDRAVAKIGKAAAGASRRLQLSKGVQLGSSERNKATKVEGLGKGECSKRKGK